MIRTALPVTLLALAALLGCEPSTAVAPPTASGSFTVLREVGRESDGHSPLGLVTASVPWDGDFVILEPLDGRVRRIPGTPGAEPRDLGSRGGGPGEFIQPAIMGVAEGKLWVMDRGARRVTWFRPDGTVDREITFLSTMVTVPGYTAPQEPYGSGRFILRPGQEWRQPDGSIPSVAILTADSAGNDARPLVVMAPSRSVSAQVPSPSGDAVSFVRQIFSDAPILAFDAEGKGGMVVERSATMGHPASIARVTRFGAHGDTVAVFPVEMPVHPVDQEAADSLILARYPPRARGGVEATPRAHVALFREHLFIPDTVPPVEWAFLDLDGRSWLGGWASDGQRPWKVFGPAGEPLGGVDLPADFRLQGARNDSIWGVRTGEWDETIFAVARVVLGAP